jgi:hypothetical protein
MFTAEEKKVVRKARQLITNRANWCKGEFAKAHNGHAVEVASQKACKFCAIGALCHAALDLGYDLQCREPSEDTPIDRLAAKVSPPELRLVDINDSRGGHRKVLALFDKALTE